jgi:hypothetical protein
MLLDMTKTHPIDFREGLDESLIRNGQDPTSDSEWETVRARYADLGEPRAFRDAMGFLHDARNTHRRPTRRTRRSVGLARTEDQRGAHDVALSLIYAHYFATTEERINGENLALFRRDVLRDKLLTEEQVGDWVESQAEKDGKANVTPRTMAGLDVGWSIETLSYARRDDAYASAIPINTTKTLGRLKRIAEAIDKVTRWNEANAVTFILTGKHPIVHSIEIRTSYRWPYASEERITMTIHPTCTPQEVADMFAEFRTEHYGRLRRLSPKMSMLGALFAASDDNTSAKDLRAKWNAWCAKRGEPANWTYPKHREQTILSDAKRSLNQLLNPQGPEKLSRSRPSAIRVEKRA